MIVYKAREMFKMLSVLLVVISLYSTMEASCDNDEQLKVFYHNSSVEAEPACPIARTCKGWLDAGITKSGIYPVDPDGQGPFQVYCDMETDGGGWTVFQRRQDGSVDFYRGWVDYEMGFGELDNEFWLGLSKIHRLTKIDSSLRVDLEHFNQSTRYAHYDTFSVGDVSAEYVLTVGGYYGTAGDSLEIHNGRRFSTKDNDNDVSSSNCATRFTGAWWYKSCHHSNLNGKYLHGVHSSYADGVNWYHWTGYYYSLKFTEMKLREK